MTMGLSYSIADPAFVSEDCRNRAGCKMWTRGSGKAQALDWSSHCLLLEASRMHGIPYDPAALREQAQSKSTSARSRTTESHSCTGSSQQKENRFWGWLSRSPHSDHDDTASSSSRTPPQSPLIHKTAINKSATPSSLSQKVARRSTTLPIPRSSNPEEPDSSAHLKQIYDMRTWEMYLRITEARKRSASPTSSHAIPNTTSIWSNSIYISPLDEANVFSNNDSFSCNSSLDDGELIFGDLEL
jgi:hypothetical protein